MSKTEDALIPDAYWKATEVARELTSHRVNGLNEAIRIFVLDQPGQGGACHEYVVLVPAEIKIIDAVWSESFYKYSIGDGHSVMATIGDLAMIQEQKDTPPKTYKVQHISFQNGPVKEAGYNGNSHEALLAILIDRMESFQEGPYKCHDNQMALDHLQGARLWLHKRTMDRVARQVEGTHQK